MDLLGWAGGLQEYKTDFSNWPCGSGRFEASTYGSPKDPNTPMIGYELYEKELVDQMTFIVELTGMDACVSNPTKILSGCCMSRTGAQFCPFAYRGWIT